MKKQMNIQQGVYENELIDKEDDGKSLLIIYIVVFVGCTSFSIVMPSIAPYLDSLNSPKTFLSYAVSIYSVGELSKKNNLNFCFIFS